VAVNTGLTVHDMQLQEAPLYGITVNGIKLNQIYQSQNTLCTNCTYLVQSLFLFPVYIISLGLAHRCPQIENPEGGSMRFLPNFGREVYSGCENFFGRVHLFGVLLHFY
jgi:hypothetical protein